MSTDMLLRRFNAEGIARFRDYIGLLNADKQLETKSLPAPMALLSDDTCAEVIAPETRCPNALFENRLAAAKYLNAILEPLGLPGDGTDVGLWSWLALRFFDQLRPLRDGAVIDKRMGTEEARFIPSEHYTDRHRHLLRGPLEIYRSVKGNPSCAMCLLIQPVYMPGDIVEQFASRQLYIRNSELLGTVTSLVVDPQKNTLRPNAPTKARRLSFVLDQFDCTWDLGSIVKDKLIPMLPTEFKEFRSARRGSAKEAAAPAA